MLLGLVLLVAAVSGGDELIATMTPDLIKEAIAVGNASENPPHGVLREKSTICGIFSTPFTRVSAAAAHAKKEYKPFGASDVTDVLTQPEAVVFASAKGEGVGLAAIRKVKLVVIAPIGSTDIGSAIMPTKSVPEEEPFKNSYGASAVGRNVTAWFPLSSLKEGNEVRIVYEAGHECRAPIKLKGIR